MKLRLGLLCLALLAAPAVVVASEVEVRAFVRPDGPISDTQRVNLVIEATGSSLPDVSVNNLPSFRNLRVISGPSKPALTARRASSTSGWQRLG